MAIFGRSKSLPRTRSHKSHEERRVAEYPLCHNPLEHHPLHGVKHHHKHHHQGEDFFGNISTCNTLNDSSLPHHQHHCHHEGHHNHKHHHHSNNRIPYNYTYDLRDPGFISYDAQDYNEMIPPVIETIIPGTDLAIEDTFHNLDKEEDKPIEYTHMRDKTIYNSDAQPGNKILRQEFIPDAKTIDTYVYKTISSSGQTLVTITDSERTFYLPTTNIMTTSISRSIPFSKLTYSNTPYQNVGHNIPIKFEEDVHECHIRNSMEHLDHLSVSDVKSNDYYYCNQNRKDKFEEKETKYIPVQVLNAQNFYENKIFGTNFVNIPNIDSPPPSITEKGDISSYSKIYGNSDNRRIYSPKLDDSGFGDRSYDDSSIITNGGFCGKAKQLNQSKTEIHYVRGRNEQEQQPNQTYSLPYQQNVVKCLPNILTEEEKEALAPTFEECDVRSHPFIPRESLSSIFRAKLDMSHFKRSEIDAKVVCGNRIIVKAIHGDRCDPLVDSESVGGRRGGKVFTKREFFTSYTLPPDCETDQVKALFTKKGFLIIECPRVKKWASSYARNQAEQESLLIYVN